MALRRPILIRWQPYMDECVEMLEAAPDAYPSDRALCQWAKLQHIAEDVAFQFSMDDPTGYVAVSDAKTQYALKGFTGQLNDWRKGVTEEQYTRESHQLTLSLCFLLPKSLTFAFDLKLTLDRLPWTPLKID